MNNSCPRADALPYAVDLVRRVCQLAGQPAILSDLRDGLHSAGVLRAIERHNTPVLFNWLVTSLSYQGIADRVASGFIRDHGNVRWSDIEQGLAASPACPKLSGYWKFHDCRYHKGSATCSEPDHIGSCPLPRHILRNGHLNQLAYSLFLFIRDVARGDFVQWIEVQLAQANDVGSGDRLADLREAVVAPLRNVYGISDKVATMVCAMLLLGAGKSRPQWFEIGASFVVIDSLVHNFLHRTGILWRFDAAHSYGPNCYRPGGCSDLLRRIADQIDARAFNPAFPQTFPRFVQSAVWRYCAEGELDICNGNRINDNNRCDNVYCRLRSRCDRVMLRENRENRAISMT